jgi:RNA polymerase sigma-70 factor (ECF subfamily)
VTRDLEPLREPLLRFCSGYLRDAEAARDAVQECFRRLLSLTDPPAKPLAWLRRAARNHCLNLLRSRRRRRDGERLATGVDVAAPVAGPLTRLVREEERASVGALLARLRDDELELLRLRYVDELARREIADLVELPESTVKSRLEEALRKLRRG